MTRFVTFGEIMLRLKSPGNERLFQSPTLEATFGGGEANVAVSLALLGREAEYVTVLPENPLADGAVRELRRWGVGVSGIRRVKTGRLGVYFLENGANQRGSTVVYDREGSAISQVRPGDLDWKATFAGEGWFHLTGITPALSQTAADTCLEALKAAKAAGWTTSLDLNYRKKLWNYGKKPPEVMAGLVPFVDHLVANEEDIQMGLGVHPEGVDVAAGRVGAEAYRALTAEVRRRWPSLKGVAVTLRSSVSADRNGWSAVYDGAQGFAVSRSYAIDDIVDRVGGGDAFSAGLLVGLTEPGWDEARALEFAVAAGCLKHSVPGDFSLISRAEVEALAGGNASGRVQR